MTLKPSHFIFLFYIMSSIAGLSAFAQQTNPPTPKAKILCPEISKLAEAVALARENQMPYESVMATIEKTIKLQPHERLLVNDMVLSIYQHPEKTIYENTINVLWQCYQHID